MTTRSSAALGVTLCASLLGIGADDCSNADPSCPDCVADFALYNPAYENDGVWEEEVTAITRLLDTYGYTWQVVDHRDLNALRLGQGSSRLYRGLIAPGGYAYWRDLAVDEAGEQGVRDFISTGGSYIGFCAGTFWTADEVVWAEEATGGAGAFNRPSDYATYPYDLGLLQGQAVGPLGWTPWLEGYGVSLQLAEVDLSVLAMAEAAMPAQTRFFYYGGPVFRFDVTPPDLEVWARAVAPAGLPAEAQTGAGEPTVVRYGLGQGRVILFSYHPEVLVNSAVDGLVMTSPVDETQVDWDTGGQSWDAINLYSWNIVHAAVQVAAGEAVTPIVALPEP